MDIIDKIKKQIEQISKKTPQYRDEAVNRIKSVGDRGLEYTREFLEEMTDKVSDLTAGTRIKYEIRDLEEKRDFAYLNLGKMGFLYLSGHKEAKQFKKPFERLVEQVHQIDSEIRELQEKYEALRKARSDSYIFEKLGNDLMEAGAIIDQAFINDKSNLVNKLLKEIRLPKDTLISAIKRNDEVIIPDGNTQLLAGDLVTVIGRKDDVNKIIRRITAG